MIGTTSGAITMPVSTLRPGIRARARASGAAVPHAVASKPVGMTISTLVSNVLAHSGSLNSLRYHCSEKPGGGNVRNCAELNEITTTISIGATRNSTVSAQHVIRSVRQTVAFILGRSGRWCGARRRS